MSTVAIIHKHQKVITVKQKKISHLLAVLLQMINLVLINRQKTSELLLLKCRGRRLT